MSAPTLVACSHGTASPEGSAAVTRLVDAVRREVAGPHVVEAFVDVHGPYVDETVARLAGDAVVVPLLLAAGHHVRVDIARAVQRWSATAAGALGPDDRLTSLLLDRMAAAGVRAGDAVVLAVAGSSDDSADRSVRLAARRLAVAWRAPVTVAYGAAREPGIADAVAGIRAREPGRRVAAVSYLLATGHFHRRVLAAGADVVTAPLLDGREPDPRLVELVTARYRRAVLTRCTPVRPARRG